MRRVWTGLVLGTIVGLLIGLAVGTALGSISGIQARVACEVRKLPYELCFWIDDVERRLDALETVERPIR
jgi:hypothetical protein